MVLEELIFDVGDDVKVHVSTRVIRVNPDYLCARTIVFCHYGEISDFLKYDIANNKFEGLPDGLQILGLSDDEEHKIMKELNTVYANLLSQNYISFE